jgi:hypothetical protein
MALRLEEGLLVEPGGPLSPLVGWYFAADTLGVLPKSSCHKLFLSLTFTSKLFGWWAKGFSCILSGCVANRKCHVIYAPLETLGNRSMGPGQYIPQA